MIYEVGAYEPRNTSWLFYSKDERGVLRVRPEYDVHKCSVCGKVAEEAAVETGLPKDFEVYARRDLVLTGEGWFCISDSFRGLLEDEGVGGMAYQELPGDSDYFLCHVDELVPTDIESAGFEIHESCNSCGRPKEKLVGPLVRSLGQPESPMMFFASTECNENLKASYRVLFTTDVVVRCLRGKRVSGVEFMPAI